MPFFQKFGDWANDLLTVSPQERAEREARKQARRGRREAKFDMRMLERQTVIDSVNEGEETAKKQAQVKSLLSLVAIGIAVVFAVKAVKK